MRMTRGTLLLTLALLGPLAFGAADDDPFRRTLAILDSKDKVPRPTLLGTLASFRTPAPRWETVLDVDALSAAEKTTWTFKGATTACIPGTRGRWRRA